MRDREDEPKEDRQAVAAQDIVAGAVWRDPERVEEWIGALSKSAPVVTKLPTVWRGTWSATWPTNP